MKTEYLFTTSLLEDISIPSTTTGAAGINNIKKQYDYGVFSGYGSIAEFKKQHSSI